MICFVLCGEGVLLGGGVQGGYGHGTLSEIQKSKAQAFPEEIVSSQAIAAGFQATRTLFFSINLS